MVLNLLLLLCKPVSNHLRFLTGKDEIRIEIERARKWKYTHLEASVLPDRIHDDYRAWDVSRVNPFPTRMHF